MWSDAASENNMTQSFLKKAERLQDALENGDRAAYEASIVATMEVVFQAKRSLNDLMTALSAGLAGGEAMVLIAGLQKFHDETVKMVCVEDNGIRHSVEVRPDNFVTRAIDRATGGEYRIMTSEGPMSSSMMNRALIEGLRRRADDFIASAGAVEPEEADVAAGPER
jgi:hypothetical protein